MTDSTVKSNQSPAVYRGRIAPTPTGFLHLGHYSTFFEAYARCRAENGILIFRDEDIDRQRCTKEFADAAMEDLRKVGLDWDAGPDIGGADSPYRQSERHQRGDYLQGWRKLVQDGFLYPSPQSRKEISQSAKLAPSGEHLFPPAWRTDKPRNVDKPGTVNWRFRVPDGREICFDDQNMGFQRFVAGQDFGDFLVWRRDGWPAYELAVVIDDLAMTITEVVRGADLLLSTARQILIYEALGCSPPAFYHCSLVMGSDGNRLAKRAGSLALRTLLDAGKDPSEILAHSLPIQP
ncbi:MAG: glutamate--tRNA ligase family protein [Opitutales bacterium]|nr:glutamate--tRNA ligase family protein [Opitutales bacterium]NRA28021.1 tRNA glutamyl-Q synthetase [Opitutales bacterium]